MTDADGPVTDPADGDDQEPDRPVPARRIRRPVRMPVRGRWPAVIAVLAVLIAVGVVGAAVHAPAAAPAPGLADGVAVPPAAAYSSSAFCSGGTGSAATDLIQLTNSTSRRVAGTMTTVAPAAGGATPTVRQSIAMQPLSSVVVNPATGMPAGSTASSFTFAGGGVVASELVSGPGGWSTAPCASQLSPQWAFAGGSTAAGNVLTLSLFNPAATDSVVNVMFLTPSGRVSPQAYQGLTIPPGGLVEENVGDFVQNDAAIATLVTSESGTLVSTEFQQWSSASTAGVSLRLGAPALSTTWRFAQTTATMGSTVDLYLANPGTTTATATLTVGLSDGSVVPHRVVLAPQSIVALSTSGTAHLPQQVPFALTVTSTAPIVAGRSVQAPSTAAAPTWGSSSGTVTVAGRWLVPAPGTPANPGTAAAGVASLAVANPGGSEVRVQVFRLNGSRPLAVFNVAPGRMAALGPTQVGGLVPLVVSSSHPVYVEEDSGPSGAPGVVSSTGFPFVDHPSATT
jgi:hypothetical protein